MTDTRPYITITEWAERHGVTQQRAHALYKGGRLPGAYESGPQGKRGTIILPATTPYPSNPRTT